MNVAKILIPALMLVFSQQVTIAEENVTFNNHVLHIPSVDTTEQLGRFQNVVFVPTEDGTWKLLEYIDKQKFTYINNARLFVTNSFPIQVFLDISGHFTGCGGLGIINQRLVGKQFEVTVNEAIINEPAEIACTADLKPFTTTVVLPVYGLEAGTYSYIVNGRDLSSGEINSPAGEFEIGEYNLLPIVGN